MAARPKTGGRAQVHAKPKADPKAPPASPKPPTPPDRTGERKFTPEQMIDALRAARGFKSAAARALGCSPRTIDVYLAEYPAIAETLEAEREALCDAAEIKLAGAINRGDVRAIDLYLSKSATARARGWGSRVEVTGKDGADLPPVVYVVPGQVELAEWQKLAEEARSASRQPAAPAAKPPAKR